MPITRVEAIPVRIKREEAYLGTVPKSADERGYFLRPPYRALYSRYFETAFVKITTSEGLFGWGEALAPVAPEVVCVIIEQILAPALLERSPLDGNVLWNIMYDLMRERGYYGGFMLDAISACDTALWDLRGKILGQPLVQLLGGAFREAVPCYVSGLPRPTAQERVELALGYVDEGFNAFKLAAGHGARADAASVAALRGALGDEAVLLLDAHWVYALDDAIQLGGALAELGAGFFEAPINPEDIDAHAKLAAAVAVPIAIGETERTRYQFRPWLEQDAAQILQPDVGRAGISEVVKIASMAEAFNTSVAPHLSVGLGICIAASIHAAAAIPNLYLLEYQPPIFAAANLLLESPLQCSAGFYELPTGAGLGVALDEEKLRALQA
ncbi:MAG: mandelate racemase/muconate lactonizing enzyme family protein [Chloroflexi bacterium]|nr:mandelate racemase/muconate lactonizing enzyme family protein [Chloroflexota bacterium]MCY3581972.1 mandelate racemase/muconate lactonizing enzyme family protein [Chloroflexota bacterium]MCY3715975.1 mandelate racemase/muconate lactonizing enzyme family protein [Chloroflexota bacterium]MDE2651546.1 mandelate racemase/muconate lactonizing enzyme family protein [Chloroflexota bacterium]MXV93138.1 mandelate racemase/muconate lactonizing enzyme family protein [Chloroflexota bacterium]